MDTITLDAQIHQTYQAKEGEEYMNSEQLAHFKNKLIAWKEQLINEARSTMGSIKENDNHVADINDRATLEEEFALELRTRDRERKLIAKIDTTLYEVETGEYGYCHTCGAEIGLNRLDARPTATECIDCKTISERREG